VKELYCRCDDDANILILILNIDKNVFGGFTPVKQEYACGTRKRRTIAIFSRVKTTFEIFLFLLMNP
jgi:hypothetical protein